MIAIAIDDEPLALELIEAYCSNLNDLQLVQSFTNTAKAKIYLQNNTVDLIFLDIQMPNISGIDFIIIWKKSHSLFLQPHIAIMH